MKGTASNQATADRPLATALCLSALRRREWARRGIIWSKLLGGVGLSLAGPLAVATVLALMLRPFYDEWMNWGQGTAILWGLMVLGLYITEWHFRGGFFEYHAMEYPDRPISYGEFEMMYNQASLVFWWELLLIAPRLVREGIEEWRRRRMLGRVNLPVAAGLMARLLSREQAMEVWNALRQDESVFQMHQSLAYLVLYDWIGVSRDGRRAWVASDARRKMTKMGRRQ